ncbi:MAG TPA: GrpB family protein [Ureibacillus sp.]|nr:GrpB family protein [Ureibacillus sp.]
MVKEVIIEDYHPDWEKQFQVEKRKIIETLDAAITIEHIGSTSIKGLGAKPILDIAIGVNDLEDVSKFIEPLKQIGYEFVYHQEFPERRFFRKGQWGAGTHHLHFYQFEGDHWNNQILFRNYLRNNPPTMMEYHQLKLELAEKHRFDRVSYTANKASFIQNILQKAKKRSEEEC